MLTHEKILATLNNSPYLGWGGVVATTYASRKLGLGWVVSIGLGVTGGLLLSSLEYKLKHKE